MPETPESHPSASPITRLLAAWRRGEPEALDELAPLVYGELRRLARRYLGRERKRATLDTHDLIQEAFVRLVDLRQIDWHDRVHFFAIAARVMRRLLLDRARRRRNAQHGGGAIEIRFGEIPDLADLPGLAIERDAELIALDDALAELGQVDERLAHVVELRFFGGLDHDEVAAVLGLSNPTVRRHWRFAKSWLHRRLSPAPPGPPHAGG